MTTRAALWLGGIVTTALFGLFLVYSLAAEDPASAAHPGQVASPVVTTAPIVARPDAPAWTKPTVVAPRALRRAMVRSSEPQQLAIAFRDGTNIVLTARPLRQSSIVRPEKLADIYLELTRLAMEGDASAGYSLHRWLMECTRAPLDAAELNAAVARLHRERSILTDRGKTLPISDVPTMESVLRNRFAFCEGAPRATRGQADAWLERAVATDETFVLRAKAEQLMLRTPREAFPAYQELWERHGDVGALTGLAFLHEKGFTGADPDLVQAYAYRFASFKLQESVYGGSVFPSHRNKLNSMEESLRVSASYLTPEQTQEAERRGRQLLADNPNCCTGLLFGSTT